MDRFAYPATDMDLTSMELRPPPVAVPFSTEAPEPVARSRLHAISRWRVKAGQAGVAIGVAYVLIMKVPPRDLLDGSFLSLLGMALVLAGTVVRLAAMGTLK